MTSTATRRRNYLADGDPPSGFLEEDDDIPNPDFADSPISPSNLYRNRPPVIQPDPIQADPAVDDTAEQFPSDGGVSAIAPHPMIDQDYSSATDALKRLIDQRPVESSPKWWQRLAAGVAGAAAGYSNAAGRARPIDVSATQENILHPGYKDQLAIWQSRVAPAEAALELESQKLTAREKQEQIAAQAEERLAHAQQRANLANPHYNQTQINPAWAKANLPGHAPDANGQYWIDKAQAVELEREAGKPIIIPAGSSVMVNGKITNQGSPKPITNALEMWQRDNPDGTAADYARFEAAQKVDPENVAHWVSVAEDPASTQAQKAVANAKIRRLQQTQVQTHVNITNSSPQNQPVQPVKEGSAEDKVASDLSSGKLTMAQFARLYSYSRDTGKKLAIYQRAEELNPNFNPALFEQGYKFFATPKIQQQMASLNNVETGVPDLLKFSDLASRSGVTALNRLIVPGGVAVGGKHYSNFDAARTAFADELSGALGYGSATDMSREMGFNMTDRNLSPENFKSAIQDVIIPFIQRKRASLLGPMGIYGQQQGSPQQGQAIPQGVGRSGASIPTRPPGVPSDAHWDASTRTWNK